MLHLNFDLLFCLGSTILDLLRGYIEVTFNFMAW